MDGGRARPPRRDEFREAPIDFTKQAVFDAGVLLAEMLLGTHPIEGYPSSLAPPAGSPAADATPAVRAYGPEELQLPAHHDLYPDDFLALVRRMLAFDPAARPSVGEVLRFLWER